MTRVRYLLFLQQNSSHMCTLLSHLFLFLIALSLSPIRCLSQSKDSIGKENKNVSSSSNKQTVHPKPEILTSGFIDMINNGQVNASARFIRLYIGEPAKFSIPLSIYSGVSSNNFQNQLSPSATRSNEQLVTNFINPLSGFINFSIDDIKFFNSHPKKVTKTGLVYHGGFRVLTGYRVGPVSNLQTGKPVNFLNTFIASGFYFQTGAWEKNNAKNVGLFWLATRYIISKSNANQLKEIIPNIRTNGIYHGWSFAWGIEINKLVNIKMIYYKYVKKPEIDYSLPIYQFSFNYSLKN